VSQTAIIASITTIIASITTIIAAICQHPDVSVVLLRSTRAGEAVVFPPACAGAEWNNHPTRVGPHLGLGTALRCFIARGCRPTARALTTCCMATLWRRAEADSPEK
jgi:hypothetical protein